MLWQMFLFVFHYRYFNSYTFNEFFYHFRKLNVQIFQYLTISADQSKFGYCLHNLTFFRKTYIRVFISVKQIFLSWFTHQQEMLLQSFMTTAQDHKKFWATIIFC